MAALSTKTAEVATLTATTGTVTTGTVTTLTATNLGVGAATPTTTKTAITSPTGGGTADTQARAAIDSIITVLEQFGLVAAN